MTSVQKILKLQQNPDGEEGHEERKQIQEASMQFPKKKKYTGGARHCYTEYNMNVITKQITEMKENCIAYDAKCNPYQCSWYCPKRDKAIEKILDRSREVISCLENSLAKKGYKL